MKKIIAIDGPAASGKGTLSRNLARELNFAHMDTGALYRAVAFEVIAQGGNPEDESDALSGCKALQSNLHNANPQSSDTSSTQSNPQSPPLANLSSLRRQGSSPTSNPLSNPDLRTEIIGDAASKVASIQSVRDFLTDMQRSFANSPLDGYKGAILDGRDIGTIICPDAPLKLYITAKCEIRATRRMKELQLKGLDVTYKAVLEDMRARDARDSGRKVAPLKPAEDAVIIDSSDLSEAQMLENALTYAKKAFG